MAPILAAFSSEAPAKIGKPLLGELHLDPLKDISDVTVLIADPLPADSKASYIVVNGTFDLKAFASISNRHPSVKTYKIRDHAYYNIAEVATTVAPSSISQKPSFSEAVLCPLSEKTLLLASSPAALAFVLDLADKRAKPTEETVPTGIVTGVFTAKFLKSHIGFVPTIERPNTLARHTEFSFNAKDGNLEVDAELGALDEADSRRLCEQANILQLSLLNSLAQTEEDLPQERKDERLLARAVVCRLRFTPSAKSLKINWVFPVKLYLALANPEATKNAGMHKN